VQIIVLSDTGIFLSFLPSFKYGGQDLGRGLGRGDGRRKRLPVTRNGVSFFLPYSTFGIKSTNYYNSC